jgi:uncharacterized ferredoxin-like protein
MRTTIEIKDEHRARLLDLAARRGEKGFSSIVADALESHLRHLAARDEARKRALRLKGMLSQKEADRLRKDARSLRESWR